MNNNLKNALIVAGILFLATSVSVLIVPLGVGSENIILIYILTVLFATVLTKSYIFGTVSVIASFFLFNYFFTEPRGSFRVNSIYDVQLLAFFMVTALVAGNIMSRLQHQTELTEKMMTEQEKLYQEREEIQVAMKGEKLRNTLLRAVSHDLRTPLTALQGESTMLDEKYEELSVTERKKLARDIREETVWMGNLVENILNMTRITDAKMILNEDYEVVDDIVEEAVSHMHVFLADRKFSTSFPDEVLEVYGDGKLISQVLINLLDNAVRHTPADAGISLSVQDGRHEVTFSVNDTGEGIDPDKRAHLFESFAQTEKSITDGQRGMGLGLSICKEIVEAHGGRIHAEDNPPHGTKMIFTIPKEPKRGNENDDPRD